MRKLILTVVSGLITVFTYAQAPIQTQPHDRAEMMAKFKNAQPVPYSPVLKDNGVPVNTESFYLKSGTRTGENIGETGYDLQSNSGAMDRVRAYADGKISAIWTGSAVADGSWLDRGMFYAHNDGASWGAMPTAKVETVRSGFGSIVTVMDHEVVISHDGATIRGFANAAIGGTTWTELGISTIHLGLWPRAYCPAGTDDIYVVSANANPPSGITFSRSDDGGATYTIANYLLPYLDSANCFGSLSADAYQIAVNGSTVYILYGTSWTNLVLLTSTSNGDAGTWTSQTLIETGLCRYQGDFDQISDVNADGIADTIETTDGFHEMVLDDAGVIHVWSGYYWLLDDDPATEGWSYFPSIYGLWYWNSTMTEIAWLDLLVDWDNVDGLNDPLAGIGADLGMYDGVTFTSMANASIDEDAGRIYLMFTHPIEYTDYFGDPTNEAAQSFRDVFGVYSDDNGLSWSSPVNMTYTAHENIESVYPYCYDRVVGDCVHTVWMSDQEPGTSLDTNLPDAFAMNDMRYKCFDEARFNPYPPVADYEFVVSDALVNFTNLSIDSDEWEWSFGDGGSATTKNTSHVYAVSGPYNVCLTAYNKYDNDQECKIINIQVAVTDIALQQSIQIYPSPASSYFNLEVEGNFGQLFAEVYNTLGERVINSVALTAQSVQFDVTTLSAGNYIVKVTSENGRYATAQITVNR